MKTGTQIYYTGDMANQSGFFEVTESNSQSIKLAELDGFSRSFTVYPCQIASKYEGHCGERFVTREAYNAYFAKVAA